MRIDPREFASVMDFLTNAFGVTLDTRRREIYFQMLCDLDAATLGRVVCEIVSTRVYTSLPTIGEIRRRATVIGLALGNAPSPVEAWEIVLRMMGISDFDDAVRLIHPPILKSFLDHFGPHNWRALVYADIRDFERKRFESAYAAFLNDSIEAQSIRIPELFSAASRLSQANAVRPFTGGIKHGNS